MKKTTKHTVMIESSLDLNKQQLSDLAYASKIAYDSSENIKGEYIHFDNQKFQIIFTSNNLSKNESEYKAFFAINHHNKTAIIANAGTDISSRHDLLDDILLSLGHIPTKCDEINEFIHSLEKIIDDIKEYKFTITGHSLGGVLSNIVGSIMIDRGFDVDIIVGYDSPGSKKIIDKLLKLELLNYYNFDYNEFETKVTAVNNAPYFINKTGEHIGKQYLLIDFFDKMDNSYKDKGVFTSVKSFCNGIYQFIFGTCQDVKEHALDFIIKKLEYKDLAILEVKELENEDGYIYINSEYNDVIKTYSLNNPTNSYCEFALDDIKLSEGQIRRAMPEIFNNKMKDKEEAEKINMIGEIEKDNIETDNIFII